MMFGRGEPRTHVAGITETSPKGPSGADASHTGASSWAAGAETVFQPGSVDVPGDFGSSASNRAGASEALGGWAT